MTTPRTTIENRQFFRYASNDAIVGNLILADGREWPICIVDQSASGFGVVADSLPPLNCGDLVELRTDSFACETRVAHMTNKEPDGSGDKGAPFRVGFTRLRDITIDADTPEKAEKNIRCRHFRPSVAADTAVLFAIVVVLVGIAVAVLVVPSLTGSSDHSGGEQAVSSDGSTHPSKSRPGLQRTSRFALSPAESSRLPGALPFVMSGVASELDLSESQIERLHGIINETNDAIAKNEEVRRLLENARRDAVGVLTHEQRALWEHLSGERRP
jgi:hypothetical protein